MNHVICGLRIEYINKFDEFLVSLQRLDNVLLVIVKRRWGHMNFGMRVTFNNLMKSRK